MLKIGDFARLANVTIKTLHHYAELGLLQPQRTDRYSGYRYYTLEQLPRINRILALKEMGFSLSEIATLLEADLDAAALRRMFDQKQAELALRVRQEQERLGRVAERLQQIEQEGRLPEHEVMLKHVPPLAVALQRLRPAPQALEAATAQARLELRSWARQAGLPADGGWLTLYPAGSGEIQEVQVALALPLGTRPARSARPPAIQLQELPATQAACLLHTPGAGEAQRARTALYRWSGRNRYIPGAPWRELLLADPEAPASGRLVELQAPVESLEQARQRLYVTSERKENEMEPKFVELPAFTVVGMRYYGKNQNQEIAQLWGEFNQRSAQIQHTVPDGAAFGICLEDAGAKNGEFEYVASFAVEQAQDVPEGMVVRQVPAHKYAVFTHVGGLDKLGDTYQYIYQVYLPASGLEVVRGLDFELYNEDFKDFAPDSRFYIYVPVK